MLLNSNAVLGGDVNTVYSHSMPYRLCVPENYDPSISYPMLVWFHGTGNRCVSERDYALELLMRIWCFFLFSDNEKNYFIVPEGCSDRHSIQSHNLQLLIIIVLYGTP